MLPSRGSPRQKELMNYAKNSSAVARFSTTRGEVEKEKGEKKLFSFGFEWLRCRERANENLWFDGNQIFFSSLFVFRVEEKNVCILMRILFKKLITFLTYRLIHFEYLEIFVQFIQILENQLIVKLINNNFINNLWLEREIDYISVA